MDVDDRVHTSRHKNHYEYSAQGPKEIDTIAKLISEYEYVASMGDREKLELLKKIEVALKRNPENCTKGPRFISQLLTHPNSSIQKSAFTCALYILSSPQNPRQMLLDAYRLSLCCSNTQVAQYALSLLPDFVNTCPEEASNLIKFGTIAHQRLPAPSTNVEQYLARAMSALSQ